MVAIVEFMVVMLIGLGLFVEFSFLPTKNTANLLADDHEWSECFLDGGGDSSE
jgi:hypothetical protein